MKSNLDTDLFNALIAETAIVIVGVELRFGEYEPSWLRYTDCDVPFYFSGDRYAPRGIEIASIEQYSDLSVDGCTIIVPDLDDNVSSFLMAGDYLGSWCYARFAALASSGAKIGEDALWRGILNDYDIDAGQVSLELVSELILWQKRSLRKTTASCPWAFRGIECGYAGASTSCNKSYERCVQLSNSDNFGGFRWLPAVAEQEIRWGGTG